MDNKGQQTKSTMLNESSMMLKLALRRYLLQWIATPTRELELEIARLEWLIAKTDGILN